MNKLTRRMAAVAAGACLAAVAAATPASAAEQARGTFFYQGVLTGSGTITNPIIGNCYSIAYTANSGVNLTDALAIVYLDGDCVTFGTDTNPGDNVTPLLFEGVRFQAIH